MYLGPQVEVVPGLTEDGTYGTSEAFVYFWDLNGKYYQWNGAYYYSDKPFRLKILPMAVQVRGG